MTRLERLAAAYEDGDDVFTWGETGWLLARLLQLRSAFKVDEAYCQGCDNWIGEVQGEGYQDHADDCPLKDALAALEEE